jgi:hypothetical protein
MHVPIAQAHTLSIANCVPLPIQALRAGFFGFIGHFFCFVVDGQFASRFHSGIFFLNIIIIIF